MRCFICHNDFVTLSLMIRHFKHQHDLKTNSIFRCAEVGYSQSFQNLCSFKKHMNRKHLQNTILVAETSSSVEFCPSGLNTIIRQHNDFGSIGQPIKNIPIIAHHSTRKS